jgi:hypothetical protein
MKNASLFYLPLRSHQFSLRPLCHSASSSIDRHFSCTSLSCAAAATLKDRFVSFLGEVRKLLSAPIVRPRMHPERSSSADEKPKCCLTLDVGNP